MFMSCAAMARAMQAGLDFAEVSTKTSELGAAANAVISERVALMSKAMRNPLAADYAEFARMVPEKVTAVRQAGAALMGGWWALQIDVGDYMLYVARAMTSGRPPSLGEVEELVERTSVHGTRIAASAIEAAGVALAPFHESATSNARRLSQRNRHG
jgi:hypothetical protein